MSAPIPPNSILVVEDSVSYREMLVLLFSESGYEVIGLETAEEAMDILKSNPVAMLILDQQLPGMNGLEFLVEARRLQTDIPAIFVAGSLKLEDAVSISHYDVAGIFTKPADPRALLRKVAEIYATVDQTQSLSSQGPFVEEPEEPRSTASTLPAKINGLSTGRTFKPKTPSFTQFITQLTKLADFRSVLMLQGSEWTPYLEIARDINEVSAFAGGMFMHVSRDSFNRDGLIEELAPLLLTSNSATLLVTGVEDFNAEQLQLFTDLLGSKGAFMPFAHRFRVIVGATPKLLDKGESGELSESLYYRISTITLTVPPFAELSLDYGSMGRHLLLCDQAENNPTGCTRLDADAEQWLIDREWTREHRDFKQVLLTAARTRQVTSLKVTDLQDALKRIATMAGQDPDWIASPPTEIRSQPQPTPPAKREEAPVKPVAKPVMDLTPPGPSSSEPTSTEPIEQESTPPEIVQLNGIARYLPKDLTNDDVVAALKSPASNRSGGPTIKRTIKRKEPGSYDFSKRLSDSLNDSPAPGEDTPDSKK